MSEPMQSLDDFLPGVVHVEMPSIPRSAFANDEDYQRAVRTSSERTGHRYRHLNAAGTDMLIPAERLVEVLHALYSKAIAVGMGVLHDANPLTLDQIEDMLVEMQDESYFRGDFYFDYLAGRPLKTGFKDQGDGTYLTNTRLYNRDQGSGEDVILEVLSR